MAGKDFKKIFPGLFAVSLSPVSDGDIENRSNQIKQLMAWTIILNCHSVQ
jgi:hypothetical protein